MPSDSDALLQQAAAGDGRALQSLLVQHLPSLVAFVRLQAGPAVRAKESISDLAQSVCVEVLRDAKQFAYQGEAQFRQWLFLQVLRKIQNRHRHHRAARRDVRREVAPAVEGDHDDVAMEGYATLCTPSRVAMGRERMSALETAFARLHPDQQQAVLLRRIVGLDYAEIAAQMGKSEGAVRNLVYRGVARLSLQLDSEATAGAEAPADRRAERKPEGPLPDEAAPRAERDAAHDAERDPERDA